MVVDAGDAGAVLPPNRPRWTRTLITLAVVGLGLVLIVGLGAVLLGAPLPLHLVLGVFLCCFAALKIGVACDAIVRLRGRTVGESDPRETHGSNSMAWGWIIYKLVAAAIALAVAVYSFTGAADRLDGMFREPLPAEAPGGTAPPAQ